MLFFQIIHSWSPFCRQWIWKESSELWTWTYCRSQNFQFFHDEGTNRFLDGVFKYVLLSLPFVFSRWVVQPSVLALLLWWFLSFLLWLPFQHIYSQIPSSNCILISPLPWKLLAGKPPKLPDFSDKHLVKYDQIYWTWSILKWIATSEGVFEGSLYPYKSWNCYLCHHVQRQQQLGRTPFPAPWWRNKAFHLSIVCTWWMNKSRAAERNLMFEIHYALKKWSKTGCCRTLSYQSIWNVCIFLQHGLRPSMECGVKFACIARELICATGSPRLMDDEAQP